MSIEEATPQEVSEVQVEEVRTLEPRKIIPGIGNVTSTFAFVGSSPSVEKTVNIFGLHLSTPFPASIQIHPRQSDNRDFGWHDQFAIQVITTSTTSMLVRIRRLDQNSGWGQNLRLDLLIFDQVNNP